MIDLLFDTIVGKVTDSVISVTYKYAKARIDRNELSEKVDEFYQAWIDKLYNATKDQELDLSGLAEYIEDGMVEELYTCCAKANNDIYLQKYNRILSSAYDKAYAQTQAQKENVNQFVNGIKNILFWLAEKNTDLNTKLVFRGFLDGMTSKNPIQDTIASPVIYTKEKTLEGSIALHKNELRNAPLISVAPERISFGALFKPLEHAGTLYLEQNIRMLNDMSEFASFGELYNEYKQKNVIITGTRGAGKTTGMKALYLNDKSNKEILYSTIRDFRDRQGHKSEYLNYIRQVIEGKILPEGKLIILDGLDEAFTSNAEAIAFVNSMLSKGLSIWIGCRSEYYNTIAPSIIHHPDGVADVLTWDDKSLAELFVRNYSDMVKDPGLITRMQAVFDNGNPEIMSFITSNPFFLTLFLFIEDKIGLMELPSNEYELIEVFLNKWYESEYGRGIAKVDIATYYDQLYKIANCLYSKGNKDEIKVDTLDESVFGFVSKARQRINGFVHWDFCVFLISKQIITATLQGDEAIIDCYPRAFLDDVTNMTWEQLETIAQKETSSLITMYNNLFSVYRQIYEPGDLLLSEKAVERIKAMDDKTRLMLKDEIIYFTLRLPLVDKIPFFNYASVSERVDHPIIELGLAYGIGMSMSHPYALNFAKKLIPGSAEEILNRSWTVAFFGDQDAPDIYDFKDSVFASWRIARNARIKRFKKNNEKAYRYRIFDIPIMFCFFSSRKWECDLSTDELEIIRACDISWAGYTDEEREFLYEQKEMLVKEYDYAMWAKEYFSRNSS